MIVEFRYEYNTETKQMFLIPYVNGQSNDKILLTEDYSEIISIFSEEIIQKHLMDEMFIKLAKSEIEVLTS